MSSCEVRTTARQLTIPQFGSVGIDVKVFTSPCNPAGFLQNRIVALQAMEYASPIGKPTLYIEDDIDLDARSFVWSLELALSLDSVVYLYLNDQPTRLRFHFGSETAEKISRRIPIVRGAYKIRQRAALFGTQCVLIPARLTRQMTQILEAERGSSPWDGVLHLWLRKNPQERVFSILPHPVQHRQDRTGRDPAKIPMKSLSFGMPWKDHESLSPWVDSWGEVDTIQQWVGESDPSSDLPHSVKTALRFVRRKMRKNP